MAFSSVVSVNHPLDLIPLDLYLYVMYGYQTFFFAENNNAHFSMYFVSVKFKHVDDDT